MESGANMMVLSNGQKMSPPSKQAKLVSLAIAWTDWLEKRKVKQKMEETDTGRNEG